MTHITQPMDTDADHHLLETGRPKRRLWLKLTIVGMLVLLLAASGWLTASALLSKSPKERFLTAEWHTIASASEARGREQDDQLRGALAKKPFEYELKLHGGLHADIVDKQGMAELQAISQVLEKLTLQLSGQRHVGDRWIDMTAELLRADDAILDLGVSVDADQIAITSGELLDGTYYVKKADLGEWKRVWEEIERQLHSYGQLQDIFWLPDAQLKEFSKRYGQFLYKHLKDDYFTVEEGVSIYTPEGTVRGTRITLELGNKELQELIVAFIDQLRADQDLQQLIVDRVYMIMTYYTNLDFVMEDLDREYLAEIVEDGLYELKQSVLELRSVGELEIEAYVTRGNRLIERRIVYETKVDGVDLELEVETSNWKAKDGKLNGETKLTLEVEEPGLGDTVIELDVTSETTVERDAIKRVQEYELKIQDEVGTNVKAVLELDMTEATVNNGEDHILFKLRIDGLDDEIELRNPEISGDILIERDQDLNQDRAHRTGKYKITFGGSQAGGQQEMITIELDIGFDVKFNDALKRGKADRSAVNLLEMSDKELEALGEQIVARLIAKLSAFVE